jgi:hypothetical protein
MAVTNFYNSSKKYSEFAMVRVSVVSRMLESFERERFYQSIHHTSCFKISAFLGLWMHLCLKVDLLETKKSDLNPKVQTHLGLRL